MVGAGVRYSREDEVNSGHCLPQAAYATAAESIHFFGVIISDKTTNGHSCEEP